MSKYRPVMSDVPQGSLLGVAQCNIFNSNMDNRTECTLSKFPEDTKLSSAVNTLDGWDVIQRDLDRLERWVRVNLMR